MTEIKIESKKRIIYCTEKNILFKYTITCLLSNKFFSLHFLKFELNILVQPIFYSILQ